MNMTAAPKFTPPTDAEILRKLVDADGAILYWQTPGYENAWQSAMERGVIKFDTDTDCYVHPEARKLGDDGYTMALGGGSAFELTP